MRRWLRRALLVSCVAAWAALIASESSGCGAKAQESQRTCAIRQPAEVLDENGEVVMRPPEPCELDGCYWLIEILYGCTCAPAGGGGSGAS